MKVITIVPHVEVEEFKRFVTQGELMRDWMAYYFGLHKRDINSP